MIGGMCLQWNAVQAIDLGTIRLRGRPCRLFELDIGHAMFHQVYLRVQLPPSNCLVSEAALTTACGCFKDNSFGVSHGIVTADSSEGCYSSLCKSCRNYTSHMRDVDPDYDLRRIRTSIEDFGRAVALYQIEQLRVVDPVYLIAIEIDNTAALGDS